MQIEDLKNVRPSIGGQIDRIVAAAKRYKNNSERIDEVKRDIEKGLIENIETQWRLTKFKARELKHAAVEGRRPDTATGGGVARPKGFGFERMLGDTSDFLSIEFFEAGLRAARPVGRLVTPTSFGTGFLVGKDVLVTNNHVLPSADLAMGSVLEMDAEENRFGAPKNIRTFMLDPDRFFATHEDLDFTFVAVEPEGDNGDPLEPFGCHPLIVGEGKIRVGDSVNVIQHPAGGPKSVVVHNSKLIFLANDIEAHEFCYYTSDTDEGSSGSPVFNDHWEVIALHHSSVPKTNVAGALIDRKGRVLSIDRARENPQEVVWIANEGVRVSRLVKGFAAMPLPDEFGSIRSGLLKFWKKPKRPRDAFEDARRPVRATDEDSERDKPVKGKSRTSARAGGKNAGGATVIGGQLDIGDGDLTIPLNIVVQIGENALKNRKK